jgi:hypothetical protein
VSHVSHVSHVPSDHCQNVLLYRIHIVRHEAELVEQNIIVKARQTDQQYSQRKALLLPREKTWLTSIHVNFKAVLPVLVARKSGRMARIMRGTVQCR